MAFLDANSEQWLLGIQARLDGGTYAPGAAPEFWLPKAVWQTRPVVALSLEDQLVYHYLALMALPVVAPELRWSERTVRFSYRLLEHGPHWFQNRFHGWRNFDKVSLGKIAGGAAYVVVTDISAYYENIDIGRLVRDLQALGVSEPIVNMLSMCWNKWAGPRGRGIPQVYSPSHVFGELFLNSIDRGMAAEGIEHIRYVDDIRIFAPTEAAARASLNRLAALLRGRGLNIQGAKSNIFRAHEARATFLRVQGTLRKVSHAIGKELLDRVAAGHYVSPEELTRYLRDVDPSQPDPAVVERSWRSFSEGAFDGFDKTLFHYLINRLAQVGSGAAIEYAIQVLQDRPEETEHCLAYLGHVRNNITPAALDRMCDVLCSDETLFEYQRYLLLRWFLVHEQPVARVLAFSRRHIGVATPLRFVRPHAVEYLSRFAEGSHDWERIIETLHEETSVLARASCLFALRRAPKAISGAVLARSRDEHELINWAITEAKRHRQ